MKPSRTPDRKIDRPHQFKILLSEEERTMVTTMATEHGLSFSDFVRQMIRREFRTHAKRVA